jgi:hypothetical protein
VVDLFPSKPVGVAMNDMLLLRGALYAVCAYSSSKHEVCKS